MTSARSYVYKKYRVISRTTQRKSHVLVASIEFYKHGFENETLISCCSPKVMKIYFLRLCYSDFRDPPTGGWVESENILK